MIPWGSLAQAIGWPLTLVTEGLMFGWSFPAFDRALRAPANPVARLTPWLHGWSRDRFVIVRSMPFYDATTDSELERIFLPPAGSGLERYAPPAPLHTMAMAEIDPPLFAGVQLVTRPSARFGHPRSSQLVQIRRNDLAARLWVTAHDADRVNLLFSYGVPSALLRPKFGVAMHDGVVEVFLTGVAPPPLLLELVDYAAQLGTELSMLSNALPMRMADAPISEEWAAVAATRGLTFDAKRWSIRGAIDDIELEARLETGHGKLATSVRAKLRWPLACGLSLRRALETERPGLFTKAPGNVFVGEKAFDADFAISALEPEAAKARLTQTGVIGALSDLAADATQVLVDDGHVFVTDNGCSDGARLAMRFDAVRGVVAALTPVLRGGAYR